MSKRQPSSRRRPVSRAPRTARKRAPAFVHGSAGAAPAKIPLEQLIDATASDLRKILARKEVRELLWRMAHKEEEAGRTVRSARHRAEARMARKTMEARVKAAAVTHSSLRCFWYNFYMEVVKQVYGFQHLGPVQDQRGDVIALGLNGALSDDGDFTFELANLVPPRAHHGTPFQTLHCEITPCNRDALQPFIDRLRTVALPVRVSLDGTLTFDPAHQGDPDVLEIHPIVAARFIG